MHVQNVSGKIEIHNVQRLFFSRVFYGTQCIIEQAVGFFRGREKAPKK